MNAGQRRRWFAYAALFGTTAVFAFPLLWMILSSLKPLSELLANPYRLWPDTFRWANYREALTATPFLLHVVNTLILCTGRTIGTLFSCSLAAYAFARLRWTGRDLLFGLMIATMLLPWHVTMIPRFLLLRELGLYNSLAALIVPSFFGHAFSIFLLRQFFLSVPEELSEAARIDGLSEAGIFWRIVLPLSRPALVTVALFQFVGAWNDFSGPLLYLNDPAKFPVSYALEQFVSSYTDQTHLLLAAAVMVCAPIAMLFLVAQRYFIEGVATTGIKG